VARGMRLRYDRRCDPVCEMRTRASRGGRRILAWRRSCRQRGSDPLQQIGRGPGSVSEHLDSLQHRGQFLDTLGEPPGGIDRVERILVHPETPTLISLLLDVPLMRGDPSGGVGSGTPGNSRSGSPCACFSRPSSHSW
jgi:hypothetical protein